MSIHDQFERLQAALRECTSYDLEIVSDEFGDPAFALIDADGDIDGDLFTSLDEVESFIRETTEVNDYLNNVENQ